MISYKHALALASRMRILDQHTGTLQLWRVNSEQRKILRALCSHRRVITLKARQIGSTLIHSYYIALVAYAHPHTPIAVLNYSYSESKNILKRIKGFLGQLGAQLTADNATELQLSNGSTINAVTAVSAIDGESKAGRGRSYRIIYSSETAYYRDSHAVFASITAALTADGRIFMESTATPGSGVFRSTWQDNSEYHKIFFGIEAHAAYRRDPGDITDAEWAALQTNYGFVDRAAAAWWLRKKNGDFGGDENRALREYPVQPQHSWTSSVGRWIPITPVVRLYTRSTIHPQLKIYDAPLSGHYYVAAIDTALGAGGDDSVIVVYDCTAGSIAASYCYNGSPIDAVVECAARVCQQYNVKILYIEENGIGTATVLLARQRNLPVHAFSTNSANRSLGMMWVRSAIMAGLAADENLLINCESCQVETTGSGDKFSGRKDFLLALAFIGAHEAAWKVEAAKPPPKVYAPGDFRADDFINRAIRSNRR